MLIKIKANEKDKIEDFIKLTSLFLREFCTPSIPQGDISLLEQFNNLKTITQEIKEKSYVYYLIIHDNKNIGTVVFEEKEDFINITEFFILKKYRKKGFSYKIIEELKQIAKENNIQKLRITIPEINKKLPKIIEKLGFIKSDFVARYIGSDIYLYENVYLLEV